MICLFDAAFPTAAKVLTIRKKRKGFLPSYYIIILLPVIYTNYYYLFYFFTK